MMTRRWRFLLLALGLLALLAVLLLAVPPVKQRVAYLPRYLQTQLNRLRPTPVIPTPPAGSAYSPEELLATRPVPTPTLIPTTIPSRTPPPIQPLTPSPVPTATPTASPSATPYPVTPAGANVSLGGITHAWQTWNNCGPTTISMNLSYYGATTTQADAAPLLKPNRDDKNVSPDELAAYARAQGYLALSQAGGDVALLQTLLSNGFPVIVETWLDPEDRGGLGHYRLLSGYDRATNSFITQDSLHGPDQRVDIAGFDPLWQVFNRKYVLVYRPEQAELVAAILGPAGDTPTMLANALATAQREAQAAPDNAYAWFNIGSSYTALGEMALAASAFDEARRLGLPFRMLWYQFEPFAAYLAVGRYQDVLDLANATLQATGGLEEVYYYRGLARQALGDPAGAATDFRAALAYNPLFQPAAAALQALDS